MEDVTPIRCAIYRRLSLDPTGEGMGIERQLTLGTKLAEARQWTVTVPTDKTCDNSLSAWKIDVERPGFERLLALIQAGQVDAVVAQAMDRLCANQRDGVRLLEACKEHRVKLAFLNGGDLDLTTPMGEFVANMMILIAQLERSTKGHRQKIANLQRAENGGPPLGVRLTGYTVSGKLLADEAQIVTGVFEDFAAGDSLRSLAARLTEAKVPTRHGNRRWNPSTVRGMLINPRYAGRAIYQGRENGKRGIWKALVDDDVYEAVQARLADPRRKTNRYGHDRKHLGAGLYECGVCGRKVYAWSGNRYRCPEACVNRTQQGVDDMVLRLVRRRLAQPDLADLIPAENSAEVKQLTAEVKRLRARIARIGEDYDAELIDGHRYKVAMEKAQAELISAQTARDRLTADGGASTVLLANDPVAEFDGAPLMIRRNVVDALCVVRLSPAPRGRKVFDPFSLGRSQFRGEESTWGDHLRAEGVEPIG